jgi:hypothetical protein
MKVAFKDDSFAFEFVRNLGFVYYGGSDVGEMMAAAGRITEGDFESWFTERDKLARRILSRANDQAPHSDQIFRYQRTRDQRSHDPPWQPDNVKAGQPQRD